MSLKKLFPLLILLSFYANISKADENNDLYEKALSKIQAGDSATALIHVKNLLKKDQDNLPARLLFAQILLDYGELAAAEDQYNRALNLKVDKSLIMLPLAKVLMLQSKYDELLETIDVGNYGAKVNSGIYTYRGSAFTQLNQPQQAKISLENALSLDITNVDAMLGLATLASATKNQTEYNKYLAMAKAQAPDNSSVWFYQGESFRRLGLKNEAIEAYNKSINITPNHIEARRSRAIINIENNRFKEANEDLIFITKIAAEDPFTRLIQALYYSKTNESRKSQDILLETSYKFSQIDSEKFDQFSPLLFIDGLTHYLLGNTHDAKKSLTKFLSENPVSDEAKEILSDIAIQQGQYDDAIKLLSQIEPQYLSKRSATLLLSAYLSKQDPKTLISTYKNLSPDFQEISHLKKLYALGLMISGESNKAIELLKLQANETGKLSTQLMLGYYYLQFQLFEQAIELAKELEKKEQLPNSALNFIAVSYESNKQPEQAKVFFKKALAQTPYDPIITVNLVQLLMRNQALDEADKMTSEFLERNTTHQQMLKLRGEILHENLKYADAISTFLALEILNDKDIEVKYHLVNLYLKLRQPQEVLAKTKDIRRLEPLSSAVLIAEAKAYLMSNNLEKAKKSLNIAFGLNFNNADKLTRIADLQINAKDWQYAERSINEIKRLSPKHNELPILKARILFGQGKADQAIKKLNAVRDKSPQVLQYLARFYMSDKQTNNAIVYARKTYEKQASSSAMQLLLQLYWQKNKSDDAFILLEQWLINNPKDFSTRRVYANLLSQKQQLDKSKKEYEIILVDKPNDVFSLNNLAILLLQEENYTNALELAQKALNVEPQSAVINDTVGWILVKQKKAEQALPYLRTSFARDANNTTTRYHLAIALAESNRVEASIAELKAIGSIPIDFPEKKLANVKLKELLSR